MAEAAGALGSPGARSTIAWSRTSALMEKSVKRPLSVAIACLAVAALLPSSAVADSLVVEGKGPTR